MATEKKFCGVVGKVIERRIQDANFGAARVGDESVGRGQADDLREQIESGADGESDIDEVGVFEGGSDFGGEGGVDGARDCASRTTSGRSQPVMWMSGRVFAQSQGEGAADEAGAEDGDAVDEMSAGMS